MTVLSCVIRLSPFNLCNRVLQNAVGCSLCARPPVGVSTLTVSTASEGSKTIRRTSVGLGSRPPHIIIAAVRVWVDDDKLVDASLSSEVTQDLKVVKIRKGTYRRTVGVPPGTHRIRVELKSGDDIRAKESTAVFKAGVARRLEANTNRVTGGLSLDWD